MEMKRRLFFLLFVAACGMAGGTGNTPARRNDTYDLILKGGWIVDGGGNPRYQGDVALRGDRIAAVGFLGSATARETLDVRGLVVAPGFIDMMGQSEINVLIDNRVLSKITQGITTEITGEGGSVAPLTDKLVLDDSDAMKKWHYREDWRDLNGYFTQLEKQGSSLNIATFVGATQVRLAVVGKDDRAPTAQELAHMTALVDTLMEQGALGVWTALEYAPAATSLDASIPTCAESGGWDSLLIRLRNPATRARLHDQMINPRGVESFYYEAGGGTGVLIVGTFQDSLRYLQGKTIAQIAAARHRT